MWHFGVFEVFGCLSGMWICFKTVDRVQWTTITNQPRTGAPPGPLVPKMTIRGHFLNRIFKSFQTFMYSAHCTPYNINNTCLSSMRFGESSSQITDVRCAFTHDETHG